MHWSAVTVDAAWAAAPQRADRRRPGSTVQKLLQSQAVLDCVALPVVVVVGVDVETFVAPAVDALGPLGDLAVGVVAAPPARAVVEADEGPIRGRHQLAEGVFRAVRDYERDAVAPQERVDFLGVPRRVPELDCVPSVGQRGERGAETLVVPLEGRRQLPEDRAQLR